MLEIKFSKLNYIFSYIKILYFIMFVTKGIKHYRSVQFKNGKLFEICFIKISFINI